MVTTRTSSN